MPLGLLLLLLALLPLMAGSCTRAPRPGEAPAGGAAARSIRIEAADSLRAVLLERTLPGDPRPTSLSASATTRFYVGERRLPGLTLRLLAQDGAPVNALLKPGMLTPVASLWASQAGWQLRFPRQEVFLEGWTGDRSGAAIRPERPAEPASSSLAGRASAAPSQPAPVPTGDLGPILEDLAWYLLAPQSLLEDMAGPRAIARGDRFIFSGTVPPLAQLFAGVELWVDEASGGVARWSVRDRHGETQLIVLYSPPRAEWTSGGAAIGRIDVDIPALGLTGGAILSRVSGGHRREIAYRAAPEAWRRLEAEELPRLLDQLVEEAD